MATLDEREKRFARHVSEYGRMGKMERRMAFALAAEGSTKYRGVAKELMASGGLDVGVLWDAVLRREGATWIKETAASLDKLPVHEAAHLYSSLMTCSSRTSIETLTLWEDIAGQLQPSDFDDKMRSNVLEVICVHRDGRLAEHAFPKMGITKKNITIYPKCIGGSTISAAFCSSLATGEPRFHAEFAQYIHDFFQLTPADEEMIGDGDACLADVSAASPCTKWLRERGFKAALQAKI